jgi:hypothetical protein
VPTPGMLGEPRMYQLIRRRRPGQQRTFEIAFTGPGASAYVFTFGEGFRSRGRCAIHM